MCINLKFKEPIDIFQKFKYRIIQHILNFTFSMNSFVYLFYCRHKLGTDLREWRDSLKTRLKCWFLMKARG